jgi:hypothetical protein
VDFVAFLFDRHGAEHLPGRLALGADELGLLLVLDVRGAAALGLAVDGGLVVGALSGTLELPFDDNALEDFGIEFGQHALEGGLLGVIPCAVAFVITAQRAELELGELGGEGGQIALAAHHARQRGHDHDGQKTRQGIVAALPGPPVGHSPAQRDESAQIAGRHVATGNDDVLDMLEFGGQARGAQDGAGAGPQSAHP